MAMLENELKLKCKTDPKLIWPILFKRFVDDGFGITKGVREDVVCWIQTFNELRKTIQIDTYNWGNALDYIIFLYTRVARFIRTENFRSLFIKKIQISLCTSLFAPSMKDTLSRTMFREN